LIKANNNMYIVITGGAGFVGSNLIKLLLKKTNKKLYQSIIIVLEVKKIISKAIELNT